MKCEPVVREADTEIGTPALIADFAIQGVWLPQAEMLFDVRVMDTDVQFCSNCSPREVLQVADSEKKTKYMSVCEERCVLMFCPWYSLTYLGKTFHGP